MQLFLNALTLHKMSQGTGEGECCSYQQVQNDNGLFQQSFSKTKAADCTQ